MVQWVKDPTLAVVQIQSLAQKLPYVESVAKNEIIKKSRDGEMWKVLKWILYCIGKNDSQVSGLSNWISDSVFS